METGNIIIRLIADMREFVANIDKAEGKVVGFGNSARTMGDRVDAGMKKASSAVIGLGAAVVAYGVKSAYDYVESLDKIRTQAGASAAEIEYLKTTILKVSTATNTSTHDLADAYLQIEKAGIRGAHATELATAAAKAAWVTGGKTVDIAKQIIAVQTLQIARGMDYASVADLIVRANQRHVGSLNTLFGVLTGKVGAALAANHVSVAQAAAISNVASKAGITQARSMVTLATSLTKIENPTKSFSKQLAGVNINANKLAEDARKPGGIINVIQDLQDHAKATGISMQTLLTTVFGPGGVGLATVLANNLTEVRKTTAALTGSSGAGLETAFGISQETLKAKLTQLKTDITNALTGVGLVLLPTVDQIATWVTTFASYVQSHPVAQHILGEGIIDALVLAGGVKMAGLGIKMAEAFGADMTSVYAGPIGLAIGASVLSIIKFWQAENKGPGGGFSGFGNWLAKNVFGKIPGVHNLGQWLNSLAGTPTSNAPGFSAATALPLTPGIPGFGVTAPGMKYYLGGDNQYHYVNVTVK